MEQAEHNNNEFIERFERWTTGLYGLNVGQAALVCEHCQDDLNTPDQKLEAKTKKSTDELSEDLEKALQDLDEPDEFSNRACQTCATKQAGSRFRAHAFQKSTDEVVHLEVCHDCAMFIANGELPFD